MEKLVFDSFALIAFLRKEPGCRIVEKYLTEAKKGKKLIFISFINLAEVYYKTLRESGRIKTEEVLAVIKKLPITTVSATDDFVLQAAELKAFYPIALADCFAAALALQEKAILITGDPEFNKLKKVIKIRWLK